MTELLDEVAHRVALAKAAHERGLTTRCLEELGTVAALVKRAMAWVVEAQ